MQVYFSHSYRDITLNSYFLDQFLEQEIPLSADQKTDIWCVAKLERYLDDMTGFVSIITRRDSEPKGYSPYIEQELTLARRSRVPRLLFVDEQVLEQRRLEFPADAVPFNADAFEKQINDHRNAIIAFREVLERTNKPSRYAKERQATIVSEEGKVFKNTIEDIAELLKREGYSVSIFTGERLGHGLDDIRLLETIWQSELCVFLLSEQLSDTHVALAMAHANCVPSIRLFYDESALNCNPTISGNIYWHLNSDLLTEFRRQLKSYNTRLVQPIQLAHNSSTMNAARSMGTMKGWEEKSNLWNMKNSEELIDHIFPNEPFVRDEVGRGRSHVKGQSARENSLDACNHLYDGIKRFGYAYEIELQTGTIGFQAVRTPTQIQTHKTATCIDLACLFASLLEASNQNPLVIILDQPSPLPSHALVGYRGYGEPQLSNPTIGSIRQAVSLGEAFLFEATGAVESITPVGAETEQERQDKLLTFADAGVAAKRLLHKPGVTLRYLIDVRPLREHKTPN